MNTARGGFPVSEKLKAFVASPKINSLPSSAGLCRFKWKSFWGTENLPLLCSQELELRAQRLSTFYFCGALTLSSGYIQRAHRVLKCVQVSWFHSVKEERSPEVKHQQSSVMWLEARQKKNREAFDFMSVTEVISEGCWWWRKAVAERKEDATLGVYI